MMLHVFLRMMTTLILAVALLANAGSAGAQNPGQGAPAITQAGPDVQGVIEEIRDSEMLVRGTDGRLHHVDTTAIPSVELGILNPGDTVVLATKAVDAPRAIGDHVKNRTAGPKH